MEDYKNKYLWITPPYIFTVGILYLWGYWSSFNINVFEYAGLSDLIKVSIIPVGSVFIFTLLGFFLGEYTISPKMEEGGGADTQFGRFLARTKWLWVTIYWLLLLSVIFFDQPEKWSVLPIIGMMFPYLLLKGSAFLAEISSDGIRSLLIMSISILPIFSFCQGKENADNILNDVEYMYTPSIAGLDKAKYLGHVAGYVFFISQDNEKVVLHKTNETPLLLIRNKNEEKPNKSSKRDAVTGAPS